MFIHMKNEISSPTFYNRKLPLKQVTVRDDIEIGVEDTV
jgi:hypothetical protein